MEQRALLPEGCGTEGPTSDREVSQPYYLSYIKIVFPKKIDWSKNFLTLKNWSQKNVWHQKYFDFKRVFIDELSLQQVILLRVGCIYTIVTCKKTTGKLSSKVIDSLFCWWSWGVIILSINFCFSDFLRKTFWYLWLFFCLIFVIILPFWIFWILYDFKSISSSSMLVTK